MIVARDGRRSTRRRSSGRAATPLRSTMSPRGGSSGLTSEPVSGSVGHDLEQGQPADDHQRHADEQQHHQHQPMIGERESVLLLHRRRWRRRSGRPAWPSVGSAPVALGARGGPEVARRRGRSAKRCCAPALSWWAGAGWVRSSRRRSGRGRRAALRSSQCVCAAAWARQRCACARPWPSRRRSSGGTARSSGRGGATWRARWPGGHAAPASRRSLPARLRERC